MKKILILYGTKLLHYAGMLALFLGGWCLFYRSEAMAGAFTTSSRLICVLYALLLFLFSRLYDAYKIGVYRVGELLYSQTIADLVSLGLTYVFVCILAKKVISPLAGFGIAGVQLLFSVLWLLPANKLYYRLNVPNDTLVIYRGEEDLEKLEELKYFSSHWNILECIQADDSQPYETYCSLLSSMEKYPTVFVSGISATLRNSIEKYCIETDKECYFVPHIGDIIAMGSTHRRNFTVPICLVGRKRLTPDYHLLKRCLDLLVSLLGIVLLSPIMLLVALAIKCQDHGSVLYRQERLTKDGKVFNILKFRSMRMDAEQDGKARLASSHDARITPVGRIIRAIRLDELPQLFNVFRGDMSLVGPRPERPEIAAEYEQSLSAFVLRLQVKAGLTGYAQIYGRYNTEPRDKLKLDLMYINRMSMFEDLRIIFATIKVLFMRDSTAGVAEGQTTAAKSNVEKSA